MHNNQSSYSRWSWIVALILALLLLWAMLTGRGPGSSCCSSATAPVAAEAIVPAAAPTPDSAPIGEAFGFSASCNAFTNTGDAGAYAWVAKSDALKSILCTSDSLKTSDGLKAEGDSNHVTLTGMVADDATKTKVGDDAQAYFGPDYTVDNQITIKAEPVAMEAPPAAKLYFDTGKTALPADNATTLEPIVSWLKAHPESKVVVSGYHDPRGSLARNQQLVEGRAKSTYDALLAAGIDAAKIEMRKPQSVDGGADLNEARRVEVSVE